MKIYFFRHGQTSWNADKTIKYCKENHNVGLNELGKKQARDNALFLKDIGIEKIYTSHLKRAYETGKILSEYINVDLEIQEDLREFSIYDDSVIGLTRQEIFDIIGEDKYKKMKKEKDELMDWRPLKCETKREARKRIVDIINKICKISLNKYEVIAISTHGIILKELLRANNYKDDLSFKNCEVIEAEYINNKLILKERLKNENK